MPHPFHLPYDGGGVLDGDRKNLVAIQHTPIVKRWPNISSYQESEYVIFFGKPSSKAFQKHKRHPLFMGIERFWSPQKGATKKIWSLEGWWLKTFGHHKVGNWNFFITPRLATEIHFQSPFVTKATRVSVKNFFHPCWQMQWTCQDGCRCDA